MSTKLSITKTWNNLPTFHSYDVDFSINPSTGDMVIKVDAPFHNNSPPPMSVPGRFPGLHNYEVVEIFISSHPDNCVNSCNPYIEIQVNPHGQYMIVYFINEGDWDNQDASIELDNNPICKIDNVKHRWTCVINIPSYLLPEPKCCSDLSVNWLANVGAIFIENPNVLKTVFRNLSDPVDPRTHMSHSALPGPFPNFHQIRAFVPLSLHETMEIRQTVNRAYSVSHEIMRQSNRGLESPYKGPENGKKIGFTRSTTDNSKNARSLLNDSSVAAEYLSNMQLESAGGIGVTPKVKKAQQNTVEQVAFALREELIRTSSASSPTEELDEKFARHVQSDEFVIMHGWIWKRKGISYKSRLFILTSKPRLLYFHRTGAFKGSIPWTMTRPPTVTKVNDQRFDVEVYDKSRVYHLSDSTKGSDRWVYALGKFIEAQQSYVKASMST